MALLWGSLIMERRYYETMQKWSFGDSKTEHLIGVVVNRRWRKKYGSQKEMV